jgi:hypothetical protein
MPECSDYFVGVQQENEQSGEVGHPAQLGNLSIRGQGIGQHSHDGDEQAQKDGHATSSAGFSPIFLTASAIAGLCSIN